jgi:hypothetical protein
MTLKYSAVLLLATLLIACVALSTSAVQPVHATDASVPVKIETYGSAWDGYLAYPLTDTISPIQNNYIVVMNTNGEVVRLLNNTRERYRDSIKYVAQDKLMVEGNGGTDIRGVPTLFWNPITNATEYFPGVGGHHDIEYNPVSHTFLALRDHILTIGTARVIFDTIVEFDATGGVLWTWDSANYFSYPTQVCPCNDTARGTVDFTHSNSLEWDIQANVIYLNIRNLNTFCKIDKTTSSLIWCVGEHGNFDLRDANGKHVSSLWYHSHHVVQVAPDVFSMFDNDFHNTTSTRTCGVDDEAHSRMLEVTVNEHDMTASVTWNWTGPRQYYSTAFGAVDRLPNGDRLATFGTPDHSWVNSTGAVLVEVNPSGQVVRTYTFPYGWKIYRAIHIILSGAANGLVTDNWGLLDGPSPDALTLAASSSRLFMAARSTDNTIWYRTMDLMDTAAAWSGWSQVEGLTDARIAIQVFNSRLYFVCKQASSNNLWYGYYQLSAGNVAGSFSDWTILDGAGSQYAVSLATDGTYLYVAAVSIDGSIWHRRMDTLGSWTGWVRILGFTDVSPAIAVFQSRLYFVCKQKASTNIWYGYVDLTVYPNWNEWTFLPGPSPDAAQLTISNSRLYVSARSTDNTIWYASMNSSGLWSNWVQLPGYTSSSVGINVFSGVLVFAAREAGATNLWWYGTTAT